MIVHDLHRRSMHRLIEKAGAKRVSESACDELMRVLEEVGLKISRDALDFTRHANRKTVRDVDVRIAAKQFLRSRITSTKH
jgi:histone H3/H4